MAVVLLDGAPFSGVEEVAEAWCGAQGCRRVGTEEVLQSAEARHGMPRAKLRRAMLGEPSVFNAFTHEREKAVASLRSEMSLLLDQDGLLITGPSILLVPRSVTHALKVCLVAPREYRARRAAGQRGLPMEDATRTVAQEDATRTAWSQYLYGTGPWESSLYDILLPMHEITLDAAREVLRENAGKPALARTQQAEAALADFQLAARVNCLLADRGHDTEVTCENGYATVALNHYAVRMEHLEQEVKRLAASVEGVKGVTTSVGPRFRQPGIYLDFDAEVPSKVLLVDDEREFVQTLSERLLTRHVGSAVAYSGEEALAIIEDDEPEVVVLDLQMPGIDGIEVLGRVKKGHPDTQVIILTGHGSDREERLARELGAFAYLNKPVDIQVLSRTMKEAYRKIAESQGSRGERP